MTPVKLTAALVENFAGIYLSPMYDSPQPTPNLHRECWELYCSDEELCAVAAPRGHAKSTALTHDFCLATALFRIENHICVVSATEDLAMGHLSDIAKELRDNDDLRRDFGIVSMPTDAKTEIVVKCDDGYQFRIIAKGSGQKLRGLKWRGTRPGLFLCDDMEEDEQVENIDRRRKFRSWFFRALLQARRRGGKVRMHGTILHEDSLLARLMKASTWKTYLYKAHAAFDDFSDILWPEQFSKRELLRIRQGFIDAGDPAGYSQEYLNDPYDNSEAYLRRDDFRPMSLDDMQTSKLVCAAADFAVSKKDKANRTSFTVGGKDVANILHYLDQYVDRWDTLEWIDVMFDIQDKWNPDVFFVEDGVIWKSIAPTIYKEMQIRDKWINCQSINPVLDKATRGRSLQRRMRAGGCRFDTDRDWFSGFQEELLRFTGFSDAVLDDQFDSAALLSRGFDHLSLVEEDDFITEDESFIRHKNPRDTQGRNQVTGY